MHELIQPAIPAFLLLLAERIFDARTRRGLQDYKDAAASLTMDADRWLCTRDDPYRGVHQPAVPILD